MPLLVPISVGELFDKISILEIKAEELRDAKQLANVMRELTLLDGVRNRAVPASSELDVLYAELQAVNRRLWRIEDDLRQIERAGLFDARFVALARSVYRENDQRATVKRQINNVTGSEIVEEKSYV
jgi:hypothetical protein